MMSASVAKISAQLTTGKYLFIQYSEGIVGWAWVWGVSTEQISATPVQRECTVESRCWSWR